MNYTEIEYSFFGTIFESPEENINEAIAEKACEDWFSLDVCRLMWAAVEELRKDGLKGVQSLTIVQTAINISNRRKSRFAGIKVTSAFIEEARRYRNNQQGGSKDIAGYAKFLRDAMMGRAIDSAYKSSLATGIESNNAARAAALIKQIQTVQQSASVDTDINVKDLLDNMTASYDKAYQEFSVNHNYNFIPGIPFPWEDVNYLTKGLNPGLHVIAARPSVGKTSFILQCITYWCDLGYKVAFDCLDMSVTEMIKRPVANLAWVSPTRMEFGWADPEEQMRVREATEKVEAMYKKGLLTVTLEPDVDKLKAWAEIRHAAGKLDILVIDFAQRFQLKGNFAASEYEVVTYVTGVLKKLANESLMPVVLLSQLSRDNVKAKEGPRPPELSDLRGSGAIEQDATSVVLLHKPVDINMKWKADAPEEFVPGCEVVSPKVREEIKRSLGAVGYNLAKNQNGPTGEVPFIVYQHCFRWYVGDRKADKADKYSVMKADWRFMEEPFRSVEAYGKAIYPQHWDKKCAETYGKLGLPLPEHIKAHLESWDLERYEKLLAEHNARVEAAKKASGMSASSIIDETPPSISKMVETERVAQQENPTPTPIHPVLMESLSTSSTDEMPDDDFEQDEGRW